ncbi:MAG: methyltransferase domain-containing protein [Acidimicrobiia bacterium]|nr:methyltransferase domain-containing protein [Acidimicrobiia bacterium]
MSIVTLDPVNPSESDDGFDGVNHPMRHITESIVQERAWGAERRDEVASFFDDLATDWSQARSHQDRAAVLDDIFDRAVEWIPQQDGLALDLGVGSGMFTATLADRWGGVLAADISAGMLAEIPPGIASVMRADASQLPLPDASTRLILLANMFLFPEEMDRVLSRDGIIIWLNSRGTNTPIHLTTQAVLDALPGDWSAIESRNGTATWAVCRRDR